VSPAEGTAPRLLPGRLLVPCLPPARWLKDGLLEGCCVSPQAWLSLWWMKYGFVCVYIDMACRKALIEILFC